MFFLVRRGRFKSFLVGGSVSCWFFFGVSCFIWKLDCEEIMILVLFFLIILLFFFSKMVVLYKLIFKIVLIEVCDGDILVLLIRYLIGFMFVVFLIIVWIEVWLDRFIIVVVMLKLVFFKILLIVLVFFLFLLLSRICLL